MRRMLKDAARAEDGEGGPLSKIHTASGSGTRSLVLVSKTTVSARTVVTCGTAFLEALRRSAVKQFVSHDRDINIALVAITPECFMAE